MPRSSDLTLPRGRCASSLRPSSRSRSPRSSSLVLSAIWRRRDRADRRHAEPRRHLAPAADDDDPGGPDDDPLAGRRHRPRLGAQPPDAFPAAASSSASSPPRSSPPASSSPSASSRSGAAPAGSPRSPRRCSARRWRVPLFGLGGILAAHVILDGAFAARVLLARLDALPATRLKTGQSLGLGAWQRFAVIDWPAIRGTLPGLAAIIFLLAFTSFPIVLLLGGGPANQTLEVAIYSAVRLDFDLSAAVQLALAPDRASAALVILVAVVLRARALEPRRRAPPQSWRDRAGRPRAPVADPHRLHARLRPAAARRAGRRHRPRPRPAPRAARPSGTPSPAASSSRPLRPPSRWSSRSASRSAAPRPPARCSASASPPPPTPISRSRLWPSRSASSSSCARPASRPAAPRPWSSSSPTRSSPCPSPSRRSAPPLEAIARSQGKLIRSLGLSGWRQFALIEWPLLGRDIGVVLALAFCFSLGDLGVIALFGTQDFATLPLLMLRALGSYRTGDAAADRRHHAGPHHRRRSSPCPASFERLSHARA